MKLLVTGATGFLGSHLVRGFVEQGHEVFILKRKYSDLWRLDGLLNALTLYNVDEVELNAVFKNKIDVVIHAATSYGANETISAVYEANVLFPTRLMETAIENNTTTFINSDTFFNDPQFFSYDYLGPYTLSKKHFLEIAIQFINKRKIKFINMRLQHLFGPKDNDSKFTMNIINSLINNVPSLKLSPGEQARDFIHVSDAVSAYNCVLAHLQSIEEDYLNYELGSGIVTTIKEFVETVKEVTGAETELLFGALPYRNSEIMRSVADNTALRNLGWAAKVNVLNGIVSIIESLKQ